MASVQERLQINRITLDNWSIREQMCLASAVACSGDQNWMSVSRTLKVLCEQQGKSAIPTRPPDWFSQKNCAVQYGHLLEEVETPKRKKRTSESNNVTSSPAAGAEPPTEAVLRRLTEDRMLEIKAELRKEQEEYAKLYVEIKSLQSGQINDEQLMQMWHELEKEQELQRLEEMRMENQWREREQKKQEMQRNWRSGNTPTQTVSSSSSSSGSLKLSTDTTAVDMDVEEIIGCTGAILPTASQAPGTSPLLSSLLKSPSTGSSASTPPPSNVQSASARSTAPTITTLLTSGTIPNSNKPAIIPSRDDAVQMLSKPLSGPPSSTQNTLIAVSHQLLSPSQSAPTLSMLLEKKQQQHSSNDGSNKAMEAPLNKQKTFENDKCSSAADSNNEAIPMDIEEEMQQITDPSAAEIDDTDPNEEQQLLEVFKNIGNIEELDIGELDIDEEVDFLKGVDEETPIEDNIDFGQKLTDTDPEQSEAIKRSGGKGEDFSCTTAENSVLNSSDKLGQMRKVDNIISSDESNDNVPLASLDAASRDNYTESPNDFLKESVESAISKNEQDHHDDYARNKSIENEIFDGPADNKHDILDDSSKNLEEVEKFQRGKEDSTGGDSKQGRFGLAEGSATVDDDDDYDDDKDIIQQIEEEIREFKEEKNAIKNEIKQEAQDHDSSLRENIESGEHHSLSSTQPGETLNEFSDSQLNLLPKLNPPPPSFFNIADTDENSSSTDISIHTRKDEKLNTSSGSTSSKHHHQRKSPYDAKTDDEMPNPPTPMATPYSTLTARPTPLRSLRNRDRSESPMIDDDATTHSDHSTTNHRSRRRYSSTPVIDSIPNSPASSSDRGGDERELRTSRKSLLSIYNVLYSSKYSGAIQRILNDEYTQGKYEQICLRPMDFANIKKNIESGTIRTAHELQRDLLLMTQNALMISKAASSNYKNILQFQNECQHVREFMVNGCDLSAKQEREIRDTKSSGSTSSSTGGGGGSSSKGRSGSRKSLRIS